MIILLIHVHVHAIVDNPEFRALNNIHVQYMYIVYVHVYTGFTTMCNKNIHVHVQMFFKTNF